MPLPARLLPRVLRLRPSRGSARDLAGKAVNPYEVHALPELRKPVAQVPMAGLHGQSSQDADCPHLLVSGVGLVTEARVLGGCSASEGACVRRAYLGLTRAVRISGQLGLGQMLLFSGVAFQPALGRDRLSL